MESIAADANVASLSVVLLTNLFSSSYRPLSLLYTCWNKCINVASIYV